ncbi:MAG: 4'-phosphopantetheinyl transferase family protein [Rhizobacter sp.]
MKRRVLSHYLPEHPPLSWQFVSGAAGKPAVAPPFPHCFNLSHSDHCVAIAIADAEVGVDIERLRPMPSAPSLAQWVLHADERRWYERHGHDIETFFRLWTLKEALLKAAGTGFSYPANQVGWQGLDEPWATARFAGQRWRGFSRRIGQSAVLAVALPQSCSIAAARLLHVANGLVGARLFDTSEPLCKLLETAEPLCNTRTAAPEAHAASAIRLAALDHRT